VSVAEFHAANTERARRWPHSLLATATHDTKRGEDARARLAVLSEIPEAWFDAVRDWNLALRDVGGALNDANTEYFIYQSLLAGWPANGIADASFRERFRQAMCKSVREAKLRTSWSAPDAAFESALMAFIDATFERPAFVESFAPFQQRVARMGMENSLMQTVLKLTAPGVPDIYQGCELWDLSFVDPDNRRPVDYSVRESLLHGALETWRHSPKQTMRDRHAAWQDGAIKLLITALLLRCRLEHAELFAQGDYRACEVEGTNAGRVCAFARTSGDRCLLVVAARFPASRSRTETRSDTRVRIPAAFAEARWRHVFFGPAATSGDSLEVAALLDELPVAVLVN
jgi:(1->4)-alpha-D-glucan 1-alpha-D-glucosylmutase